MSGFARQVGSSFGTIDLGSARIRPWQEDDAASLAQHANDPGVWQNMRDAFPHPYDVADATAFIAAARQRVPDSFFAIAVDNAAVGGIGYTMHTDVERVSAEIGYWLGRRYWGRGIMSAALAAFTEAVFARHPELTRLYAVPFATNPASARVLEKAGYRLEGHLRLSVIKDGRVLDQWVYGRGRGTNP
jgi:[ribosomal protein S5]-alanine N-acetyltransferase